MILFVLKATIQGKMLRKTIQRTSMFQKSELYWPRDNPQPPRDHCIPRIWTRFCWRFLMTMLFRKIKNISLKQYQSQPHLVYFYKQPCRMYWAINTNAEKKYSAKTKRMGYVILILWIQIKNARTGNQNGWSLHHLWVFFVVENILG